MSVSSDDDFHFLYALPFDTCVFPQLLSLFWMVVSTGYLHFFLSPTLRNCYIALVHPDLARESIGTRCAALEDLDIVMLGTMTQDAHLSEIVRSCKALTCLQCPPLDSAAWKHLSTVPTLLNLSIHQESFIPYPPSRLDTHNISFATFLNVTALRFCYAVIPDITAVIQHSEFPSLKELELAAHGKARHTLEHISIFDNYTEVEEPPVNSLAMNRELLCFTQLRTLDMSVSGSIDPDNGILLEAIVSWPHLRSLRLCDPHRRPPKVTFRGLFAALRLCPHLHTLLVGVDAMNIDIDPKAESFQHISLKKLVMYSSPVADAEAVARIIFSMLPDIQPNIHLLDMWEDVNAHLKSLKSSSSL
ncbi:hypothetical protein EDB19DRAFT_2041697 [Suillus lakei]|nr:hypothetical protein EDB19DRAFT_2041697 [Suillus lakei]